MFVFWMCKIFCSLQLKPHKREYLQSLTLFLCYPLYALYLQTFCYFNFLAKKNNVWVFSFPPYFLHKREHPPTGFHGFFFSFYQWLLRIVNIQFIMIFSLLLFFDWQKVILVDGMQLWITFLAQKSRMGGIQFLGIKP